MPVFSDELAADVERRCGFSVQMLHYKHGIFDDADISVIALDTVGEIASLAGVSPDVRRFRPNILIRTVRPKPFEEDEWVGGALTFGEAEDDPSIAITMRDLRCGMLNLDPDTGIPEPGVMKAVVRVNQNHAGVYATVTRTGRLSVGARVFFRGAGGG